LRFEKSAELRNSTLSDISVETSGQLGLKESDDDPV
jgi:hypothetical protein